MVDSDTLRTIALSFPETSEQPHFEKTSFRVKQKIFATYDAKKNQACVKLSLIDQNVFAAFDQNAVFAVPNKWGQQGWTFVNLDSVDSNLFSDIVSFAYCEVAPAKIAASIKSNLENRID